MFFGDLYQASRLSPVNPPEQCRHDGARNEDAVVASPYEYGQAQPRLQGGQLQMVYPGADSESGSDTRFRKLREDLVSPQPFLHQAVASRISRGRESKPLVVIERFLSPLPLTGLCSSPAAPFPFPTRSRATGNSTAPRP